MDLSQLRGRRHRLAEDRLYFFTGLPDRSARAWFDDMEMVAKMIHADESVLLKQAVGLLIGGAERWYQNHQHSLTTWSDFKQRMIAQFDTNPQKPLHNMQQIADHSDIYCFQCVYMHHYKVNPCSHTLCHSCFYAAIEEKVRLNYETFICPRCPASAIPHDRRLATAALKHDHAKRETAPIMSRKQLSPLSLMLRYDHTAVVRQIDESINDIVDTDEKQRVEKVLWKNWFLFIEPVQTQKIDKLLRRQRSQFEFRQKADRIRTGHNESAVNCFNPEQLNNTIVLDNQDISNSICPESTESLHFRDIEPHRPQLATKESSDLVLHDITHPVNTMQPDLPAIAVKNDSFCPDGTKSWHFYDVKPQRELFEQEIIHPLETLHSTSDVELAALNPIENSGQAVPMLIEPSKSVPIVPFVNYPLREDQTVFQPPIVPYAPKLKQNRYQSLQTDPMHTVSYSSCTPISVRSKHRYQNRLLRLIGTSIALIPRLLLSILLRFGIIHRSLDDSNGIGDRCHIIESTLVFDSALPSDSKQTLKIVIPYVKTIETLRALESLLIYAIT
jgi:hypothetical protein